MSFSFVYQTLQTLLYYDFCHANGTGFLSFLFSLSHHFLLTFPLQANGTLECSEALKIWAPVREAAGLSHHAMAMWCNISLQPVFEAYNEAVNTTLNMSVSR